MLYGLSRGEILERPDDFIGVLAGGADLTDYTTTSQREDYAEILAAGSYPDAITVWQNSRALVRLLP